MATAIAGWDSTMWEVSGCDFTWSEILHLRESQAYQLIFDLLRFEVCNQRFAHLGSSLGARFLFCPRFWR